MTESRMSAEEFARLMALAEDDPERQRAASTPEFAARLAMLREFESPTDRGVSDDDAAAAGRELEARLAGAFPDRAGAVSDAGKSPARTIEPTPRRSLLERFFGGSAPRMAVSFAALLVVAATVTWISMRPEVPRATRGGGTSGVLEITERPMNAGAIELNWRAYPGADGYRVVFYGSDMNERARLADQPGTRAVLRTDALPAGLERGTDVLAEITALSGTDPLASSRPRLIHIP